jgi:hypothetical protein
METFINFKQTLVSNWHFMRWLRLGLGLFVGYQAIVAHDALAGLIAVFLLYQAVSNTGCGGVGGCAVPTTSKKNNTVEDVEFEEVKTEKK